MRRRQFVGTAASAAGASIAGCSAPGAGDRHPFAGKTVTVRIDDESESDHDVRENVRGALEYWEAHAPRYVDFEVAFDVVDDDDPDMVIRYVDEPSECSGVENFSERVLGCAPIITPGRRLRGTVRAVVVAGARPFGKIRITTKHEIGHILGLYHDDEPQEIMSNDPARRIPMFELRIEIWETVLDAHARGSGATRLFNHGVETWRNGDYEVAQAAFAAANVDFRRTRTVLETARTRVETFADDPRVETVDLDGLRTHLNRLVERMELATEFTAAMADASAAAAAGDASASSEHLATANDRIAAFNERPSPELRDVAIALGLVRGFDRDEEIGDVDEDEIEE